MELSTINRILIANRGEIAVRIMKTARNMGIECVAIKTDAEPGAMYLDYAGKIFDMSDETPEIPVFLDVDKLIEIALATGCDALHPGYGFLAENAYFAQKCGENRINFIGPAPDAIYKMGNKPVARQIALKHPVISQTRTKLLSMQQKLVILLSSRQLRAVVAEACVL